VLPEVVVRIVVDGSVAEVAEEEGVFEVVDEVCEIIGESDLALLYEDACAQDLAEVEGGQGGALAVAGQEQKSQDGFHWL